MLAFCEQVSKVVAAAVLSPDSSTNKVRLALENVGLLRCYVEGYVSERI